MNDLIINNELVIRLSFLFGIFTVMALWEIATPKRPLTVSKPLRWANNIGLVILNNVLLRLLFPAAVAGMAVFTQQQGWGILNYYEVPFWAATVISLIALDFFIYLQHVMFHAVPILWRVHRVHQADLDFDITTWGRFHPFEIILLMLLKFAVIIILGPPVLAVILFEIILIVTAMFIHGNVSIPRPVDRIIRWLIVTPDMHRVHHSAEVDETNSNFSINLSIWDRLFGTYLDQPQYNHQGMTIGLCTFREIDQCEKLPGILSMPFFAKFESYAINQRPFSSKNKISHE